MSSTCADATRQAPQKRPRETHHPVTGEKYFESPEHTKQRLGDASCTSATRPNASSHPAVASHAPALLGLGICTSSGASTSSSPSSSSCTPGRRSAGAWSSAEDSVLRHAVATSRGNWKRVSMAVNRSTNGKRSEDDCIKRWSALKTLDDIASAEKEDTVNGDELIVHCETSDDGVLSESAGSVSDMDKESGSPKPFAATGSTVFSLSAEMETRGQPCCHTADASHAVWSEEPCKADGHEAPHKHHHDLQVDVDSESDEDSDSDSDEECAIPYVSTPDREDLPSLGSAGHFHGLCKRCCFHSKGRCLNGYACNFCHFDHEKRKRKNKNKNKKKKSKAKARAAEMSGSGTGTPVPPDQQALPQQQHMVFPTQAGPAPTAPSGPFVPSGRPLGLPPMMRPNSNLQRSTMPLQLDQHLEASQQGNPIFNQMGDVNGSMRPAGVSGANAPFGSVPSQFRLVQTTQQKGSPGMNTGSGLVGFDNKVILWVEGLSKKYQFDAADLCQVLGASSTVVHQDGAVIASLADSSAALQAATLDGTLLPDMGGAKLRVRIGSRWLAAPPVLPTNTRSEFVPQLNGAAPVACF